MQVRKFSIYSQRQLGQRPNSKRIREEASVEVSDFPLCYAFFILPPLLGPDMSSTKALGCAAIAHSTRRGSAAGSSRV